MTLPKQTTIKADDPVIIRVRVTRDKVRDYTIHFSTFRAAVNQIGGFKKHHPQICWMSSEKHVKPTYQRRYSDMPELRRYFEQLPPRMKDKWIKDGYC